jgi:glycogen phosphorylase
MTRLSKVCDVHAARRPRSSRGATIKGDIQEHLFCSQATLPEIASRNDYYLSFAHAIRDKIMHRWIHTDDTYRKKADRTMIYLSAEYLLGPQLGKNVAYLRIVEEVRKAARDIGLDIREILEHEEEPGLGSGGLGRLAACFLDSLATLQIPAVGHGIRYEFGMFKQQLCNKEQREIADKWLHLGNPWEIARPEIAYQVKFGGRTEVNRDERGHYRTRWIPDRVVKGTPYDTPIVGYDVNTVNILRLWHATAQESFDFQAFNVGDYYRAVDQKMMSENISLSQ